MANKTVLLVDDEPLLLKSTGRLLEGEFNLFQAQNGHDALDIFVQMHIDCAIIDVDLGDMNGFELVSKFRVRGKKTPVIMVSGKGFHSYQSMIQVLEVNHCLQKPYEIVNLISMIQSITS